MHTLDWILANIIGKIWPPLVAVAITQFFVELRKPRLKLQAESRKENSWKYVVNGIEFAEVPYAMFRFEVRNRKLLFLTRETALQCKAELTFYNMAGNKLFIMQGRWANTPEISLISPVYRQEKLIYPDTVNIGCHEDQPLDCIIQCKLERDTAYGWNNEIYATDFDNCRYKLGRGTYRVGVNLSGQNFKSVVGDFNLVVAETWSGTYLATKSME